jgi:hypothetical protein
MNIHLVFMESLAIIQLISMRIHPIPYHLTCSTTMVVARSICQVLSSSLWDYLVSIFLLLIGQTIYRAITCDILLSNLNSSAGRRVP